MEILGSLSRIPHDVILEANPALIGDTVSIHLAQKPSSAALWTLHVDVHIAQGWFRLGSMITSSPSDGAVPARTVATGNCPGAIGWRVVAECATPGEVADLVLQSSSSSAGMEAGVTALEGLTAGDAVNPPWRNTFTTELVESLVMRDAPAVVRSISVSVDAALASGTYFVQLWNLAAVPVDGTVITQGNGLASPVPVVHELGTEDIVRFDFAEFGIDAPAGVVITLSSTRFVKTAVVGDHLTLITGEFH